MKACPIYFHFRLKSCAFRIFNLFPLTDSQCIQTWRGRIGSREAKNDRNHQKVASSAPQWFTEGYALYNPISSSIGYISINRRVPWRVWDGHFERNFVCISRLASVNSWEQLTDDGIYYGRSWTSDFSNVCANDGYDLFGVYCAGGAIKGLRMCATTNFKSPSNSMHHICANTPIMMVTLAERKRGAFQSGLRFRLHFRPLRVCMSSLHLFKRIFMLTTFVDNWTLTPYPKKDMLKLVPPDFLNPSSLQFWWTAVLSFVICKYLVTKVWWCLRRLKIWPSPPQCRFPWGLKTIPIFVLYQYRDRIRIPTWTSAQPHNQTLSNFGSLAPFWLPLSSPIWPISLRWRLFTVIASSMSLWWSIQHRSRL